MKKHILFLFAAIAITLTSCYKEPDHYLRISNGVDREITIIIDDTIQHTLDITEKTDYFSINEGYHTIGGGYQGNFTISGEGKYEWTLTILDNSFELNVD